ncbi:MAG: hypothetical protein AB7L65_00880 [Hyphomonadaceae bacterium]
MAFYFVTLPGFAVGGAMALAPAQALLGLLGAPWRRLLRQRAETWMLLAALAAFAAWACASVIWAPDPQTRQGWRLIGGLIGGALFVLGAGIDGPSRRLIRATGAAAMAVMLAGLAVEALAGMPINRIAQPHAEYGWLMRNPGRGATVAVVLTWGALGALVGGRTHERILWKAIAVGAGFIALQFDMAANAIGFALGAGAFALGFLAFRLTLWTLIAGLCAWLIAAPWATPRLAEALGPHLPDSWIARVQIWRAVCARIAADLWRGDGLDAARHYPEIPLHPHSGSLQIWVELGGVGVSLAVLALIAAGLAAQRAFAERPAAGAALCGVIASAGLIANVSYGVWQEWWIATIFSGVALAVAARRAP